MISCILAVALAAGFLANGVQAQETVGNASAPQLQPQSQALDSPPVDKISDGEAAEAPAVTTQGQAEISNQDTTAAQTDAGQKNVTLVAENEIDAQVAELSHLQETRQEIEEALPVQLIAQEEAVMLANGDADVATTGGSANKFAEHTALLRSCEHDHLTVHCTLVMSLSSPACLYVQELVLPSMMRCAMASSFRERDDSQNA